MRFRSLHMKDFRGARELEISFEPDVTVIVGRNGSGKTSILDALAICTKFVREHMKRPKIPGFYIQGFPQDIRIDADRSLLGLRYEYEEEDPQQFPRHSDTLQLKIEDDGRISNDNVVQHLLDESETISYWPHLIYCRQNRGFKFEVSLSHSVDSGEVLDTENSSDRSLDEDGNAIADLEQWWDRRDAQEARRVRDGERDYRDPQLDAVRELIARIDSFSGIAFNSTASPPGLHFVKSDGTPVHVSGLAGGERSYIVLLADLARRLQVFAPGNTLGEIPAIVLIDEVELNLHPGWQSEVVPTLTDVFRACQFIVTTHSPQVLSGVDSGKVRIIEEDVPGRSWKVTVPLSTRGRTSNYLLEGVLGASERYPPIDTLIGDFNTAIDREDVPAATQALEQIEQEIGDDAPTLLVLRKRLKTLRGGG
ncbi:MAG: AAA family ATPase [Defluviicoccus sp.]|nr:AAA family ATPase [Defluviicoccus sp.]MDE0278205.1 AAA family ATPase [Defluviicoccus sp.]